MTTARNPFVRPELPARFSEPLGFKPNGDPFYLIGGGSQMQDEIPPAPPAPAAPRTFTQEEVNALLGQARNEEKDKLYSRLQTKTDAEKALEEQVQTLLADLNSRKQAEDEARRQAEELARQKEESELSVKELLARKEQELNERFQQTSTEWEQKFQQMAAEREQEKAILEKERTLAQLASYIQAKLAEHADDIAPQLRDFVGGNTIEEIDDSIQRVLAKSAEIAEAAREAFNASRAQMRGVAPTGYAPVGPMDLVANEKQLSPQDIANMPMQEYAKIRAQLIGNQAANKGLYS